MNITQHPSPNILHPISSEVYSLTKHSQRTTARIYHIYPGIIMLVSTAANMAMPYIHANVIQQYTTMCPATSYASCKRARPTYHPCSTNLELSHLVCPPAFLRTIDFREDKSRNLQSFHQSHDNKPRATSAQHPPWRNWLARLTVTNSCSSSGG
jgi:hypothetical protein